MKHLFSLLFALLFSGQVTAFTLCIEDADYSPFLVGIANAPRPGLLVELVQMAAAENNSSVSLIQRPWKRCIDMLSKGQVDALAATIWLPEREDWGVFPKQQQVPGSAPDRSLRLWSAEYPIFVSRQSTLNYDGSSFSGIHAGLSAPPGYVVWQRLKDAGVLNDEVLLPKAGLRLVALNRLDGYVVERNIGLNLLRDLAIEDKVETLPQLYGLADWYLIFSHQFTEANAPLTQGVWQTLGTLREHQGPGLLKKYQTDVGQ